MNTMYLRHIYFIIENYFKWIYAPGEGFASHVRFEFKELQDYIDFVFHAVKNDGLAIFKDILKKDS
jgi:hypothetical protein